MHLQTDAKLRGALLQQILIGNDNKRNIRRRGSKLNTQVYAYSCGFTGCDRQGWNGNIFHLWFEPITDFFQGGIR